MHARPIEDRRANVLRGRPLVGRISERCRAPAEAAYALLAELPLHVGWGGRKRSKRSRLLTISAPPGPARVGTEFSSTGEDSLCRMADRSVVTEATPPRAGGPWGTFEFVTESSSELKRGGRRLAWTIVHRYDVARERDGCLITYTYRATRATSLPGPFAILRVPALRWVALRISMSELRGGLVNLASVAEERSR